MEVKACPAPMRINKAMDWQPVTNAPFDCDLELAVIERDETHAVVFPCRRGMDGWINAKTGERVGVRPTHWREWQDSPSHSSAPATTR